MKSVERLLVALLLMVALSLPACSHTADAPRSSGAVTLPDGR